MHIRNIMFSSMQKKKKKKMRAIFECALFLFICINEEEEDGFIQFID